MPFLKIELNLGELKEALVMFKEQRKQALEQFGSSIKESAETAINQLINAEMSLFLGQADQRDNKRNGYETKDYALKGIGLLRLRVPVDRKRRFSSAVIPKNERIDPRLKEDMAALSLAGISTRTLAMMSKRILGIDVSHETVSKALPLIKSQAESWLQRPIKGEWWALLVDGSNFDVVRRGSVEKEPSLVVLGIDTNNKRSILAIEPGTRDSASCWKAVFKSLKDRGLDGSKVRIGVMDGLPGLEKVFREEFPSAVTARCWFHALQNALAKAPKRLQSAFHLQLKKVMYAKDEEDARGCFDALRRQMEKDCSRSIACVEKDLESLLSHYRFPKKLWQALKTTNAVERIHKEVKRRTRSMDGIGEATLNSILAFTALRLELAWQRRSADSFNIDHLVDKKSSKKEVFRELYAVGTGNLLS